MKILGKKYNQQDSEGSSGDYKRIGNICRHHATEVRLMVMGKL